SWAARFEFKKIPLMVKPIEEVRVEEPVVAEVEFTAEEEQEQQEENQQSVYGTFSEEDADLIQVAQPVKEVEQPDPSPIEEEHMGEIKSELRPLNEESIIEDFLLSFQGPDLINEPMMEDNTISETLSVEQQKNLEFFLLLLSPSSSSVEKEFELSNFMFEEEGNHGELVADQEDTMEE
ncbi:hypothetical protein KI387_027723, partial [Taxus chinensis]